MSDYEKRMNKMQADCVDSRDNLFRVAAAEVMKTHSAVLKRLDDNVGVKHDNSKPDMTDIPLEAMWEMGAAFTYGQKKYTKNNYRKGMLVSRQLAAAVRHIYQHLSGETKDPESGVSHLGHALASLAMACYTLKNHPQLDDRFEGDLAKEKNKNGT